MITHRAVEATGQRGSGRDGWGGRRVGRWVWGQGGSGYISRGGRGCVSLHLEDVLNGVAADGTAVVAADEGPGAGEAQLRVPTGHQGCPGGLPVQANHADVVLLRHVGTSADFLGEQRPHVGGLPWQVDCAGLGADPRESGYDGGRVEGGRGEGAAVEGGRPRLRLLHVVGGHGGEGNRVQGPRLGRQDGVHRAPVLRGRLRGAVAVAVPVAPP
mmetsp:Transcript_3672/g.10566  ORF Transcript_3672/g.10566 Transcript_3672/m.10566 type:complete len:214 (+) Transcript_3672:167-808(+)